MIVVVLSTLIDYCHPSGSGESRMEGNGVVVEWEWEIIGEARGERREGLSRKRWGLMVPEKESIRKKVLNATQLFSQT